MTSRVGPPKSSRPVVSEQEPQWLKFNDDTVSVVDLEQDTIFLAEVAFLRYVQTSCDFCCPELHRYAFVFGETNTTTNTPRITWSYQN